MKIFEHLESFVHGNITLAKTYLSLIKLETKLAALSIFPLILNICMLLVLLTAIWLSVTALLTYSCYLMLDNLILAFFSVLGINLIMLVILLKYMMYNLKSMSFEKTRKLLSQHKRPEYDKLKNPGDSGHCANRTEIADPKN